LTLDQIGALRRLLDEHGWFEEPPVRSDPAVPRAISGSGAVELVHKIRFASPTGAWRETIRGSASHLDPVIEFIREIAQARHEVLLHAFPQPNEPESEDE
jgi:hypothetical protein